MTLLREKSQRLDNIDLRLQQNLRSIMTNGLSKVKTLDLSLKNQNPISKLNLMKERINSLGVNLNRGVEEKLKSNQNLLEKLYKNIQILNPLSILDRGYAIIMNESGIALKAAQETSKGEKLKARLSSGSVDVIVKKVNE
jgi:exodeoxyribonuclease VII large subunit